MWFNQKSSYFLDTFGKQSRYFSKLISGNNAYESSTIFELCVAYIRYIGTKTLVCFSEITAPLHKSNTFSGQFSLGLFSIVDSDLL